MRTWNILKKVKNNCLLIEEFNVGVLGMCFQMKVANNAMSAMFLLILGVVALDLAVKYYRR